MYPHHPTYYFLIDRDHHDIDFINRSWYNFPDPNTHNLLIWRKREIENYFLEPNWLNMIQGKQVFTEVAQSSCFRVEEANGTVLQGYQKIGEIVKELLRKPDNVQPTDFVELKKLITKRIDEPN